MKKCFKCGVEKPLASFYKHSGMSDGHLNKCKECTKIDVKKHRKENDSVREHDRKRGNRQDLTYLQKWRADNPKKYKAHLAVNNAVRNGSLINPNMCSVCRSTNHIEGHHDDYDQPLVVRWLCSRCHSIWHAEYGEALNAQ